MFEITTQFEAGETVVKESMADRVHGLTHVGGKLWLTDRRLIFKSRAIFDPYELSFPLGDIVSVEGGRQMAVAVMVLTLGDGRQEKFRVFEQRGWLAAIQEALAGGSPPPFSEEDWETQPMEPLEPTPPPEKKEERRWVPIVVGLLVLACLGAGVCLLVLAFASGGQ